MKRGYANTPEGQMHYTVEGSGEPLLLLHQTGSSRSLMKLLPLLSKDYRVFAIDNLGEGNSDPLPPQVEIRDMARSYVHFMDARCTRSPLQTIDAALPCLSRNGIRAGSAFPFPHRRRPKSRSPRLQAALRHPPCRPGQRLDARRPGRRLE